jgi:transmembrane sensor
MPSSVSAIDPVVVRHAAKWMARMWSGNPSAEDQAACDAWRQADPEHERAWQRLQVMEGKLTGMPQDVARHALLQPAMDVVASRRKTIRLFGLLLGVGGVTYGMQQGTAWQLASADYSTATGEIREVTLPDGTHIILNTASAIDVRFDERERRIVLNAGEVFIATAPDNVATKRPFLVQTKQGIVEALGTRFTVHDAGDIAHVAVYEGAVAVTPRYTGALPVRINAGQQSSFSAQQADEPTETHVHAIAWTHGTLVAENMRVDEFVANLSRYRHGVLRCDPAIAGLQVTGVFSVKDTDRALDNLTLALPVEVVYRTRYWVTVRAKAVL